MKYILRFFWLSIILLSFAISVNAQVYSGSGGSISNDSLPNNYSINVSMGANTIDYNFGLYGVMVNISHQYVSDLNIFLIAPNGVTVELSTKNGGSGDNFSSTIFTNNATTKISSANAPFNGTFRPDASLSVVNQGQNPNGIWKLLIVDGKRSSDAGSLLNWSVIFSSNPSKPIGFTSSSLPLMIINTNGIGIPDEPKVNGTMIIVNNDSTLNYLTDASKFYTHKIKIESRGSTSQNFPKKPYGFFTVDANGNDSNAKLLGMPKENSWILNATYNDKSLMRDVLTYELARRTGRYATRWRYCELFINGKYEGIYVLMEKIKRDDDRVDIAKMNPATVSGDSLTGGYILKIDKQTGNFSGGWTDTFPTYTGSPYRVFFQHEYPEIANMPQAQINYIRNYIYLFENALAGSQFTDPVTGYRKYANVGSFIDLSIMNEISKNVDGYRLSTYLYKDRDSFGGKLTMGPIWDFNLAWNNADYNNSSDPVGWEIDISNTAPFWWKRLRQDTAYMNAYKCRWNELRQTTLSFRSINNFIDSTFNLLKESSFQNFQRWPVLGLYVWPNPSPLAYTMEDELTNLKAWIVQRFLWMDSQLLPACNNTMACKPRVRVVADKTTVCKNQTVKLYADGVGTQFTWFPSMGLNNTTGRNVTALLDTNRTYRVVMQTTSGCSDTAYISLYTLPLPAKGITGTTNICKGNSTLLTAAPGAVSYKWSPTTTLDTSAGSIVKATPNLSTTYKVVMRNSSGCSDSSYFTVIVNPGPQLLVDAKKDSICYGESDTLIASGSAFYKWLPAHGLNDSAGAVVVVNPNTSTVYKVIGITAYGCLDTAEVMVKVLPKSFLKASANDTVICNGKSTVLNATGAATYQWLPQPGFSGATSSSVMVAPNINTTYRVAGITALGCLDTASILITVNPNSKTEISASDTAACSGNSALLTAKGAATYTWLPANGFNGGSGNAILVNPIADTTKYFVIGTNSFGCSDTGSITIIIRAKPLVKISGGGILCKGDYTQLRASGAYSYSWYPATALNKTFGDEVTASPDSAITYYAIGTATNGCIDTASITISVKPLPTLNITPPSATILKYQNVQLLATGAKYYSWSPATGLGTTSGNLVTASPLVTTTYTVTGVDENSCLTQKNITVFVSSVGLNSSSQVRHTFSIFPNPVEGASLNIIGYDLLSIKNEGVILDMLGKELIKFDLKTLKTTLNISYLNPGVYLMKIGDEVQRFEKH